MRFQLALPGVATRIHGAFRAESWGETFGSAGLRPGFFQPLPLAWRSLRSRQRPLEACAEPVADSRGHSNACALWSEQELNSRAYLQARGAPMLPRSPSSACTDGVLGCAPSEQRARILASAGVDPGVFTLKHLWSDRVAGAAS